MTSQISVVALRKESVDRNCSFGLSCADSVVALRKESVDRNTLSKNPVIGINKVALRKESVDRNEIRIAAIDGIIESLSARRAWIEI